MKGSPLNRGDFIGDLLREQPHGCTNQILYALFSCLTPKELGNLFFESLDKAPLARDLRQYVRKHTVIAVEKLGPTPFIPLVEQLFSSLEPFDTQRAILVNSLLFQIIEHFPHNYVYRYFKVMIDSHRYNDRHRACEVSAAIWSEEIEEILWRRWEELREERCLLSLISSGELRTLIEAFKSIWDAQDISYKAKNLLLKRIAETDFASIKFLRDVSPISYLYGAVIAGDSPTKDEALQLARSARKMDDLRFAIWCLGQLGQWEAILELNSEIPKLESSFEMIEF